MAQTGNFFVYGNTEGTDATSNESMSAIRIFPRVEQQKFIEAIIKSKALINLIKPYYNIISVLTFDGEIFPIMKDNK